MRLPIGFSKNPSTKSANWSQWRKNVQIDVSAIFSNGIRFLSKESGILIEEYCALH